MDISFRILTIFGSIGLFLFGMKLLSEALQKVVGVGIRRTMAQMTSTTLRRVAAGGIVTAVVQSSSAVTVMIVSFVNAGIVTLRQAVGLIMGANIGTTITAWLICLFGFKLSLGSIAVPLAGLGFVFIVLRRDNYKAIGSIVMGFAILFIGLNVLQETFGDLVESSMLSEFLRDYSNGGVGSTVLMILVGTLLTAVIQSSSATITLTLVLCQNGWIPVEAGMAMILGENIGTTVTSNIAAIVANRSAKRAALSHTLINLIGVLWVAPLLPFIVRGLDGIAAPFALAIFHTLFNCVNVTLLVNFVPQIIRLSSWIIPMRDNESPRHLRVFDSGLLSTAEISVTHSERDVIVQARSTLKMFMQVRGLIRETDSAEFDRLYAEIGKHREMTSLAEHEIISYLTELSRSDLSRDMVLRIQNMFRITSHIESIVDICQSIAWATRRKREKSLWFDTTLRNNINMMFDLVEQAFCLMIANLESPTVERLTKSEQTEIRINELYAMIREEQLADDIERDYKHTAGMIFVEMVRECEKIGDNIYSITKICRGHSARSKD